MLLCILLWTIVLIPVAIVLVFVFAKFFDLDSETAANAIIFLALAALLATPNLLWFKSVRDVMYAERQPVLEQPTKVEVEAPAVFHPELMVQ